MAARPICSGVLAQQAIHQTEFGHSRYSSLAILTKRAPVGCTTVSKNCYWHAVRCSGDDSVGGPIQHPQYHKYNDPNTGEPAPRYGTGVSLPDMAFWAEDMSRITRMVQASAPAPTLAPAPATALNSKSSRPMKKPGSGRRKFNETPKSSKGNSKVIGTSKTAKSSHRVSNSSKTAQKRGVRKEVVSHVLEDEDDEDDPFREDYVTYELQEEEKLDDTTIGVPHALVQVKKGSEREAKQLSNEELWWNWRTPSKEKQPWSAWHRRPGDSDTAMAAAMAEIGQIKLFGEKPSVAEATLARARKKVFYKERLQKEEERKHEVGAMAYYKEWVKAWEKNTSKEAVQNHFEETGEDIPTQLLNMFQCQTTEEYRRMMGTDIRIRRDPLTMRMREDQIKQVWGGDPVYPTINYVQDPDAIADYRGPNFHEPVPDIIDLLRQEGRLITREELQKIQELEAAEDLEGNGMDDAMAEAIDIGDKDADEDEEEEETPRSRRAEKYLSGIGRNSKQMDRERHNRGFNNDELDGEEEGDEGRAVLPTTENKIPMPPSE